MVQGKRYSRVITLSLVRNRETLFASGLVFSRFEMFLASPTDPSFWPIHPTLERLLHAKYMIGGFKNDTWADELVCQHSSCYEEKYNGTGYDLFVFVVFRFHD
jgi:hypothetical protein